MRDYEEKSFYEIQLDNKQLILVFLAGLVLCVLVFVLGVMVGKGQKEAEMAAVTTARPEQQQAVKNEPALKTPEEPKQNLETEEKTPPANRSTPVEKPLAKPPAKPLAKPVKKEAKTSQESYSFYDLDKKDTTTDAELEKPSNSKKETPVTAAKNQKTVEAAEPAAKSSGIQYTVQVMATASKPKADQELASLRTKGYKAFLDEIKTHGGVVYKVRVGKFSDSAQARDMAARLKRDLKLETWVAVLD